MGSFKMCFAKRAIYTRLLPWCQIVRALQYTKQHKNLDINVSSSMHGRFVKKNHLQSYVGPMMRRVLYVFAPGAKSVSEFSHATLSDQNSTENVSVEAWRGWCCNAGVIGMTPPSTQEGSLSSPFARARNVGARLSCVLTRSLTAPLGIPGPLMMSGTLK